MRKRKGGKDIRSTIVCGGGGGGGGGGCNFRFTGQEKSH